VLSSFWLKSVAARTLIDCPETTRPSLSRVAPCSPASRASRRRGGGLARCPAAGGRACCHGTDRIVGTRPDCNPGTRSLSSLSLAMFDDL